MMDERTHGIIRRIIVLYVYVGIYVYIYNHDITLIHTRYLTGGRLGK